MSVIDHLFLKVQQSLYSLLIFLGDGQEVPGNEVVHGVIFTPLSHSQTFTT
ncbi:hypothetical protein D3C76_1615300 [compost metagenome]